ncbi:hypothetical protein EBZ80_10230 [bacterium]|nr:hypothetical protein [bacterium]
MKKLLFVSAIVSGLSSNAFAEAPAKEAAKPAAPAVVEPAKVVPSEAMVEIEGTIVKLVARKKEIYVKDAAGKKHEFYFTDKTTVTSAGAPVEFSALKEGASVRVSAEKHGKRLTPVSVEIR